jgi:acetyl-CoA acetyltransferase
MSEQRMKDLRLKPMAYIKAYAFSGSDPRYAYKATPAAVKMALNKPG